tara:strand:- start:1399 stop:1779 length:381 start_codon:yes stop_codon:yes gene_type:complete
MGHDTLEIDWSIEIPKVNTTELCLNDSCVSSWPVGSTDTRCDFADGCAQVCIGTNCKTAWPAHSELVVVCVNGDRFTRRCSCIAPSVLVANVQTPAGGSCTATSAAGSCTASAHGNGLGECCTCQP